MSIEPVIVGPYNGVGRALASYGKAIINEGEIGFDRNGRAGLLRKIDREFKRRGGHHRCRGLGNCRDGRRRQKGEKR